MNPSEMTLKCSKKSMVLQLAPHTHAAVAYSGSASNAPDRYTPGLITNLQNMRPVIDRMTMLEAGRCKVKGRFFLLRALNASFGGFCGWCFAVLFLFFTFCGVSVGVFSCDSRLGWFWGVLPAIPRTLGTRVWCFTRGVSLGSHLAEVGR